MSYNMRRGGNTGYGNSAASVGQRRPGGNAPQQLSNNFVSGGQMSGQQQGGPRQQGPPQKGPQQQPQTPQRVNTRQQQQQQQPPPQQQQPPPQQQQPPPQQQQPPPQQQQPPPQQQQPPPQQQQQPKIVFKAEDAPPPPLLDNSNNLNNDSDAMDTAEGNERRFKKKPFWMHKKEGVLGKITKKERLRRRNQRLRKILQPKNALMVLNELIGSAPYNMSENMDMYEGTVFKCTVMVDNVEHIGVGKSKPAAKTAAAEAALKYMVLSKLKNAQTGSFDPISGITNQTDNGNADGGEVESKMEIDDDNLGGISWSHVACYALHKLLSSWDEGTNLAEKLIAAPINPEQFKKIASNEKSKLLLQLAQAAAAGGAITAPDKARPFEKKPAKKLPDTAATMNPIMLLNQMHPNAVYEEVSKSGNPPHVLFTIKCTVGTESFLGTGSTKKGARKMCAFAACRKLLSIEYTPAFLEEHGFSEDAVSVGPTAPPAPAVAVA